MGKIPETGEPHVFDIVEQLSKGLKSGWDIALKIGLSSNPAEKRERSQNLQISLDGQVGERSF